MQFAAIFPPIRRKTFAGKAIAALLFQKFSRKENHTFPQRTPICKYFCFWEEGEFFAIYNMTFTFSKRES